MKMSRLVLAIAIIPAFLFCITGITLADESASDLRTKGYAAQYDGDTDKAIEFYEKALSLEPSATLYNDLGVCYEEKGLYKKAEEYYLKAAKLKDGYAAAHTNLAIFYENKGELTKAAYHWEKRLSLAKDGGDRWAGIAREHLKALPRVKLAKESEKAPKRPMEKEKSKPHKKKPRELNKDMPPYFEKPMPPKKIEEDGNRGYLFKRDDNEAKEQKTKEELIEEEVRRFSLKGE